MALAMPAKLDDDRKPNGCRSNAPRSWIRKVDEWRRQQAKIPNMSAAIRELVELGLEASGESNT